MGCYIADKNMLMVLDLKGYKGNLDPHVFIKRSKIVIDVYVCLIASMYRFVRGCERMSVEIGFAH